MHILFLIFPILFLPLLKFPQQFISAEHFHPKLLKIINIYAHLWFKKTIFLNCTLDIKTVSKKIRLPPRLQKSLVVICQIDSRKNCTYYPDLNRLCINAFFIFFFSASQNRRKISFFFSLMFHDVFNKRGGDDPHLFFIYFIFFFYRNEKKHSHHLQAITV